MSNVASNSNFALSNGRPADAKTGTQDFALTERQAGFSPNSQAWTIGFTPQLVTAVWFGHYDKPGPILGRGNGGGGGTYNVFAAWSPARSGRPIMDAYLSAAGASSSDRAGGDRWQLGLRAQRGRVDGADAEHPNGRPAAQPAPADQ